MASEREAAKEAVVRRDERDPELDSALANAATYQLELKKEENRHRETINRQNLGVIGNLFGDGQTIPTTAALITVIFAFLVAAGLYVAAYHLEAQTDLWMRNAERSTAVALAALAYLFGKGSR